MLNSEWTVEVVKVFSVETHPNADKLDLIKVAPINGGPVWDYTIVDQRGRKPGDLVIYISVDSLLPLDDNRWGFLRSSTYVVGSGKYHRVRGKKLRGIDSQGLIIDNQRLITDVPGFCPDRSPAEILGIKKYEPPEINIPTPKTVTPVKTGVVARLLDKLFPGNVSRTKKLLRNVPDYSVLSLRKTVPFNPDERIVVTEKIHGTNVRFGTINTKKKWWQFGKKNVTVVGSHHTWKYVGKEGKKWFHFYGADLWTNTILERINMDEMPENVIYYGEIYGVGIQDLTYGATEPKLIIFPVAWDIDRREWFLHSYPWMSATCLLDGRSWFSEAYSDNPPQWNDAARASIRQLAEANSLTAAFNGKKNQICEGAVIHSLDRPGVSAKYVSQRYMERT